MNVTPHTATGFEPPPPPITEAQADEMLDGFEDAPSNRRLPYIVGGVEEGDEATYKLEVIGLQLKSGFGGDDFGIGEFKVLEASGGEGVNAVGSLCSDVIKISGKYKKSGLGNLRDLVAAVKNVNPGTLLRKDIVAATKNDASVGAVVNCIATQTTTKSGGPFTRKTYTPIETN